MNKKDLLNALAEETRLGRQDLERVIDSLAEIISKKLVAGEDVTLMDFGTFDVTRRKARNGYNPHTGEQIKIPEIRLPTFRPSKKLKQALNPKK